MHTELQNQWVSNPGVICPCSPGKDHSCLVAIISLLPSYPHELVFSSFVTPYLQPLFRGAWRWFTPIAVHPISTRCMQLWKRTALGRVDPETVGLQWLSYQIVVESGCSLATSGIARVKIGQGPATCTPRVLLFKFNSAPLLGKQTSELPLFPLKQRTRPPTMHAWDWSWPAGATVQNHSLPHITDIHRYI